jgi:Protein of unknown function (DUF3105)
MAAKGKSASKNATKSSGARGNRPSRRSMPPPVAVSRPKPWGLIAATVAVVLFAVGVIGYAVLQVRDKAADTPEARAAAAAEIEGVTVKSYPGGQHKPTAINYPEHPPFGGEHDPQWADCTGTVYDKPIRSENAVHSLEHGAVWVTYRPGLSGGELDALRRRVTGVDYMFMSPYPELKTKVSLQAWGHQLFVDSADDERIDTFITDLKNNPANAPEPGASCISPEFKANPKPPSNPAS